jgi:GNAT superfamily N-acetyltransferase
MQPDPWTDTRTAAQPDPVTVVLRPMRRGEVETVETVFAGMSSHSRHLRFHGPRPRLTAAMRRELTAVDGERHVAIVAEVVNAAGRHPIGIGRLIATAPGTAEVAFAVVDRWHGLGVGRRLLTALAHRAADLGHRRITAYVMLENLAATRLLRSVFPDVEVSRDGMTLELTATVAVPAPAAVTGLAA